MITIVAGVIVWFMLIVLILRFFAVCSEERRRLPNSDLGSRNPKLHTGRDTDTEIEMLALLFYTTLLKINEATQSTSNIQDNVWREIDSAKDRLTLMLNESNQSGVVEKITEGRNAENSRKLPRHAIRKQQKGAVVAKQGEGGGSQREETK